LRRWGLAAALLWVGSTAAAQDVLDDVEWDAILKATAPQVEAEQAREARAALEEKPRGKRARAKERIEIEKAAATVEALGAEPAASEPEKPEKGKPGKRGKRGKAAAAEEQPERASGKGDGAIKGGKTASKQDAGKTASKADSGKAGAAAREESGKTAAREEPSSKSTKEKLPPIKRGPNDRGVPANYIALKRYWHAPWEEDGRSRMAGLAPPLIIHPVHPLGANPTPYVLLPESTDGGFNEAQIDVASQAWASWEGGPRVSERLLNLIYHAAIHFDQFHVHLISGVRHDRGGSRHSHALAADIVLPGVSDEELATYFRAQGFCGVGIYTRAGFVHIDTRDSSYFWLDWSLPGKRNRQQQILGDQAKAADEAAVARGQGKFVNPPKLQKALEARLRKRKAKANRATAQHVQQEGS
jgi:hypothetical protein